MSEFKDGQLVACWDRDDCDKTIRIFVCKEGEYFRCRMAGEEKNDVDRVFAWTEEWSYCIPLEEVEPGAFLGCDKEIVDNLQKERERLHQAIGWLCDRLEEASREHHICPPNALPEDCDNACWECWQQAVHEAMENTKDE